MEKEGRWAAHENSGKGEEIRVPGVTPFQGLKTGRANSVAHR